MFPLAFLFAYGLKSDRIFHSFVCLSTLSIFQSLFNMSFRSRRIVLSTSSLFFCWRRVGGGLRFSTFFFVFVALSRQTINFQNICFDPGGNNLCSCANVFFLKIQCH